MDEGVGAKLREARSRRRIGLGEVEEAIKIRARYLRAIETEDWDQLPGDTYARAFIRTYGTFLGLDGERLAEEHRRERGDVRPAERLPRAEPRPARISPRRKPGGPRVSPGFVTALVVALVVAALLVIGLSSGGSDGGGKGGRQVGQAKARGGTNAQPRPRQARAGHELELLATSEVWVCLEDGKENALVDGAILAAGERAGPFRSGSFRMALGNGAVTMTVDGKKQSLPEPSSPIGFLVDSDGAVRELPEGERPTCT